MTNRHNFSFSVRDRSGQVVQRCRTTNRRRFLNNVGTINWKAGHILVHLKVDYGKGQTNRGTTEVFFNDGDYDNREDLLEAFRSFVEPVLRYVIDNNK
jgi:hypothetical protein